MADDATEEERLELMKFPCDFPLKVFGHNHDDFEDHVLELLRRHCPGDTQFSVSRNQSSKGKYQSLTIRFTAYSRSQLDDIYQSLTDSEQVVMSL
jgi:putative lipoic acid-binding regulatory protein